jgi:hypothetical protein
MYSKIILCLAEKEDEILAKQVAMLSERHHADVEKADADRARGIISDGKTDILLISDNEILLSEAKVKGIATNTPDKMRESYAKAMEMLKTLGRPNPF